MSVAPAAVPAPAAVDSPAAITPISYEHLVRLSDDVGLFEHAELTRPRLEHGYCVDDVARGLVVVVREPDPPPELAPLARTYLDFVLGAVAADGQVHNRRAHGGDWTDAPSVDDCWGRALWGLGAVVARAPDLADEATPAFERAAQHRSRALRAMSFAAMGAAEVLALLPRHAPSRRLLEDAARLVDTQGMAAQQAERIGWPWPEPRLRYANAVVPETLLAAGSHLDDQRWASQGLAMLSWLLDVETTRSPLGQRHLAVTPVGGWGPGERRPGFDQQPIEVAALADACARAADLSSTVATGPALDFALESAPEADERRWQDEVLRCEAWFRGANDAGVVMMDETSGGGFDGLEPNGRNENRGAESTLALLSTLQQANRFRRLAA